MTRLIQNLPEPPALFNFTELFGRTGLVELEIGVGKARFLRERAMAFPNRNFIGIEKSAKWLKHGAIRLEKATLENVRLYICFAEHFLENYIPSRSISICHVYFPDPWPKRRHQKRRLFDQDFCRQIERILTDKGELHVATDHEEYFFVIREALHQFMSKNFKITEPEKLSPFQSNFQAKYVKEGRDLLFARAIRD